MRKIAGSMLCVLALTACSDDGSTTPAGSSGSSTSSTTGAGGAGGGGGHGGDGGGGTADCAEGLLCLDVKEVRTGEPIAKGRVAVAWSQLSDNGPDPVPQIAYDAPFDPAATRVTIPLAQIALPGEQQLLCPRACDDEAMCPCTADPKVGIGVVIVAKDADASGALDLAELPTSYGMAYMALGYSDKAFIPAPELIERIFPDGVREGLLPYQIKREEPFDRLATPTQSVFDLNVCSETPDCEPPRLNLN